MKIFFSGRFCIVANVAPNRVHKIQWTEKYIDPTYPHCDMVDCADNCISLNTRALTLLWACIYMDKFIDPMNKCRMQNIRNFVYEQTTQYI